MNDQSIPLTTDDLKHAYYKAKNNMTEEKNCTITIKQRKGENIITTSVYELDDYRVATAICIILDNIAEVDKNLETNFIKSKYYSGAIGFDVETNKKEG